MRKKIPTRPFMLPFLFEFDEDPNKATPSGWIKWKKGNQFLITWALLD